MSLSAASLQSAIAASTRTAEALGAAVNVAVVDVGGNLAAFLRMPGSFQPSIDIAIDKAWTANGFGMSTAELAAMLETQPDMVRNGLLGRPRVAAFPGGLPIRRQGNLIGGIGVSGGSAEQDNEIALSGLKALTEY